MGPTKIVIVGSVVALGLAGATAFFFLSRGGSASSNADSEKPGTSGLVAEAAPSAKADRHSAPKRTSRGKRKASRSFEPLFANLPEKERRLCESIQAALDNEDFAGVLERTKAALSSELPEVRQQAVEALGWFGEKALPELTSLMGDRDETVARTAMDAWELGLADVEKAADRVSIAKLALTTITDPDALAMIGGQFSSAASDFVDAADDDKTAMKRRVEVLQTVVDMIEDDKHPARSKTAGEIYEEITGHAWAGIEEAERYLKDPENYEPPEN